MFYVVNHLDFGRLPALTFALGSAAGCCLPPPCFTRSVLWPPAPRSRWKTLPPRVGLRDTGGDAGARTGVAGAVLVRGRCVGLMCSPSRRVSLFRLTARSTWSTCPASRPVTLSQLLRCKVSPGARIASAHVWWDCSPPGPASPVYALFSPVTVGSTLH